jgi:hypothetical protein
MKIRNKGCSLTAFWLLFFISVMLKMPQYSMTSTVSGKVIDKETGKGIPGVSVNISYIESGDLTETNKDGEFVFLEAQPGEINIAFIPPPPYALPFINEKEDRFVLEKGKNLYIIKKMVYGGVIIGRAYDKNTNNGLEIDNVWVYKHLPITDEISENGEYRIDQIMPGHHTLKIRVPGFGPRKMENIEIESKEFTKIDFPFDSQSPTKIVGKIICENANYKFSNLEVTLFSTVDDLYSNTFTDQNGDYIFYDVEPGEYKILVAGVKEDSDGPKPIKFNKIIRVFPGCKSIVNLIVDCTLNYSFFNINIGEKK